MDGNRFDNLSRALGSGVTRRTFLGGVVGAIAASLTRASSTRTGAKGPAPSPGNALLHQSLPVPSDSLCSESFPNFPPDICASPETGLLSLVGCQHPTQVGGTTDNICSSLGNNINASLGLIFDNACLAHDCCWATCGALQPACDLGFRKNMLAACAAAYPLNTFRNVLRNLAPYMYCTSNANVMYRAVGSVIGTASFVDMQNRFCGCCDAEIDCQARGGELCDGTCVPCENGHVDAETCECIADPPVTCTDGGGCDDAPRCGENDVCVCFETTEGTGVCHAGESCGELSPCHTSADCTDPAHPVCSKVTCCGTNELGQGVCIQPCDAVYGVAVARAGLPDGPTTTTPYTPTSEDRVECPEGQRLCLDTCVDILADPANCGDCGIACGPDRTCIDGTCMDITPTPSATTIPTEEPTAVPTEEPTSIPTEAPIPEPTAEEPTLEPTVVPTEPPTPKPTAVPVEPTEQPADT